MDYAARQVTSSSEFAQRISVALHRAHARAVLRRLFPSFGHEEDEVLQWEAVDERVWQ